MITISKLKLIIVFDSVCVEPPRTPKQSPKINPVKRILFISQYK